MCGMCLYTAISRRLHGRRGLKYQIFAQFSLLRRSPPSRAAWIEILTYIALSALYTVAAFTGGVD